MSRTQLDTLIHMANQIAANMHISDSDDAAAEQFANHLRKFWARSMKSEIIKYARTEGDELLPLAKLGVLKLRDPAVAP